MLISDDVLAFSRMKKVPGSLHVEHERGLILGQIWQCGQIGDEYDKGKGKGVYLI